jgi:predicted amidohydrolase
MIVDPEGHIVAELQTEDEEIVEAGIDGMGASGARNGSSTLENIVQRRRMGDWSNRAG